MRVGTVVLLFLVLGGAFSQAPSAQSQSGGVSVAGEVLVKFRPGVSGAAMADAHREAGGTRVDEIARTGVQRIRVASGNETAALARYRSNPNVLYAEPNYIRRIPALTSHPSGSAIVPGDFYFDEQWALHNTGQMFQCIEWLFGPLCFYVGTPDADIDAPEAWGVSTGSDETVIVAVIDSGIDRFHPDLQDTYAGGWDFLNGDSDPFDDQGHGTHVSGTIAAALNNMTGTPAAEEGVVGVAPHARILAYKVCGPDGSCSDFAISEALDQAVIDGAHVVNMSLGGPEYSQAFFDAVQAAYADGLVIVAGAGNDGAQSLFYPAAFPNVVSVGAFDEDHLRASFSNYGNWVDIAAPGNAIMSAYPMAACAASTVPGDTGCYTWNSGTSMATPHVSGAAALVLSRPDVTSNAQVVEILLNSADPQGVGTTRLDSWTVHGGLNLHNAMSYGVQPPSNLPPVANAGADQAAIDTDSDGVESITLDGTASSDPDGDPLTYQWSSGGATIASGPTAQVPFAVGVHNVTLTVVDPSGASGTDTVVIVVNSANQAPSVSNISLNAFAGTAATITLLATDPDPGHCELTFAVESPTGGAVSSPVNQTCTAGSPNRDTAQVAYQAPATPGTYTFRYRASDGIADSGLATVTINVKRRGKK